MHGDKVHIIWFHEHVGLYVSDIIMITKTIGGNWPSAYERISWHPYDESIHAAFDIKNNRLHVTYMEGVGTQGGTWRLRYKEGELGQNWEATSPITLETPAWYPDLEVDQSIDSHIIWGTRSGNLLYQHQVNDTWQSINSISNMYCPLQHPDLHFANGVLCAVWLQETQLGKHIYYSVKTPPGTFSTPTMVEETREGDYPQVWIDTFGYAHFVYDERGGGRHIKYEKIQVYDPPALLAVDKDTMSFTLEGDNPPSQSFNVKNEGSDSLTYTITKNEDWLSLSRSQGTLQADEEHEVTVSIDAEEKDEGIYTDTILIESPEAVNSPEKVDVTLTVLAPPIYEPLNFSGKILVNKALFYREYIHKLTWQANPDNRDIVVYRLFRNDGVNRILIATLSATTFEYVIRGILDSTVTYNYELAAVDKRDREGPAAKLDLSGTGSMRKISTDYEGSRLRLSLFFALRILQIKMEN
jgi:hypothetical protein